MSAITRHNMSMVTLVIGRYRAASVLEGLFEDGVHHAMLSNARGTLIQDKWYQSLLPMVSPELSTIQMLVPDPAVDAVLEQASKRGRLHRSGSGAVFSTPCNDLHATNGFPLWPLQSDEKPDEDASTNLSENLTAIYFISQGERSEAICRAAMSAGSHGPIVQYSEGHGLRDRLGWLRITSKPIKEVVSVLVDNVDANLIFSAMAEVGQVDQAARGLIYRMPVQKGLVNLDAVYSETRHAASVQQIIRAIDDLKGNKDWRTQDTIAAQGGNAAGLSFVPTLPPANPHENQSLLCVIVDRDNAAAVTESLIDWGAPGANIDYLQFHAHAASEQSKHRELAHIRIVLEQSQAEALEARATADFEHEAIVYSQAVNQLLTYRVPAGSPSAGNASERTCRGTPIR